MVEWPTGRVIGREDSKAIEKAIVFLVNNIQESGHNPKSVILHSIRVGNYLLNNQYPMETAVAGLLHDILEDTGVKVVKLSKIFGEKVAALVEANSFDAGIKDQVEQYRQMFRKCTNQGKEALIVKAADLIDNAPYYALYDNIPFGTDKITYFLELAAPYLSEEIVLEDLKVSLARLKAKAGRFM